MFPCRLSRAVGPEQAVDLAGSHLEIQVVQGLDAVLIALKQVVGAEDWFLNGQFNLLIRLSGRIKPAFAVPRL
jgi:hypothetical protein